MPRDNLPIAWIRRQDRSPAGQNIDRGKPREAGCPRHELVDGVEPLDGAGVPGEREGCEGSALEHRDLVLGVGFRVQG